MVSRRNRPELKDRLAFLLDRLLSESWRGQFLALIIFAALIIGLGSLLLLAAGQMQHLLSAIWWTFVRVTDTGYMGGDEPGIPRAISIIITLAGWVIFGLLVSIVSAALQERLTALRQGQTRFLARGHSVVLGWNTNTCAVLDELACEDDAAAAPIVVLSDRRTETMAAEVRKSCRRETYRRVYCRSGRSDSPADLKRVSVETAREIVALNADGTGDGIMADAAVLRSLLALNHCLPENGPQVVAEFHCPLALELVSGIEQRGRKGSQLTPVVSAEVLGRILAQCALQPGLARVFEDLFAYGRSRGGSNEIYLVEPCRTGLNRPAAYEELAGAFADAVPIGYQRAGGSLVLNPKSGTPDADAVLQPDDHLVVVAMSPAKVRYAPFLPPPADAPPALTLPHPAAGVLVVGGRHKAMVAARELATLLAPDSLIACTDASAAAAVPQGPYQVETWEAATIEELMRLIIGRGLGRIDALVLAIERPTRMEHDDFALMTLAAVRAASHEKKSPRVVMELLDAVNLELAQAAESHDIIVSPAILSDFLVQLVRQPARGRIYAELLSAEGSELYIKPPECYLHPGERLCFAVLSARARARGETAIGYFPDRPDDGGMPILCPPREQAIERINGLIVLAEDCR